MRDAATDVPADYEPPLPFQARSLQHSRVALTWDADDDGRKRALTRRLNADEVKEDDFRVRCSAGGWCDGMWCEEYDFRVRCSAGVWCDRVWCDGVGG